jgi:hypothetical protein
MVRVAIFANFTQGWAKSFTALFFGRIILGRFLVKFLEVFESTAQQNR